jgi:hypothetical protein
MRIVVFEALRWMFVQKRFGDVSSLASVERYSVPPIKQAVSADSLAARECW